MAIITCSNWKNHPQFGADTINYICKTLRLRDESHDDSILHTYFNCFENGCNIMMMHSTNKYTMISNLDIMVADYSSGSQKILLQESIHSYNHMKEIVERAKKLVGISKN